MIWSFWPYESLFMSCYHRDNMKKNVLKRDAGIKFKISIYIFIAQKIFPVSQQQFTRFVVLSVKYGFVWFFKSMHFVSIYILHSTPTYT